MMCNKVRFSEDLGKIYKVRLGFYGDTDTEENWLLDTVRSNIQTVSFVSL